jgi:hypothetical protein
VSLPRLLPQPLAFLPPGRHDAPNARARRAQLKAAELHLIQLPLLHERKVGAGVSGHLLLVDCDCLQRGAVVLVLVGTGAEQVPVAGPFKMGGEEDSEERDGRNNNKERHLSA